MAVVVGVCGLHRLATAGAAPRPHAAERRSIVRRVGPPARSVLLWTLLLAGVAWPQDAPATLEVTVRNGTTDGASVVGDVVIVQILRRQQLQGVLEATVGETGTAVFAEVPTGSDLTALARVKHQDMTFPGKPVSLARAEAHYSTVVPVFDVSEDTSSLSVGTHHIMLAMQGPSLGVTEYMQLKNGSDRAVRAAQRDAQGRPIVIEVLLPEGAKDLKPLSFFQSGSLVMTATGFYDTLAVPPGEHPVRFSYRIDIDRPTIDVVKGISLPTLELVVFWEEGLGRLTGLGEPDEQLVNDQGVPVEYYRRNDLQPGDKVAFQISGFNGQTSDADTWIALAVAFGIVVALAIWRLRPGTSPPPPAD